MKCISIKRLFKMIVVLVCAMLLFLLLYQINTQVTRLNAAQLHAQALVGRNPVLLEGGQVFTNEQGKEVYRLRFFWEDIGYLYFPLTKNVSINQTRIEPQACYRGYLCELPYSEDGYYNISIEAQRNQISTYETSIYLGAYAQINDFLTTVISSNSYVQGLCFAVTLFSCILYFWKRSEKYLLWLALFAFFVGSNKRLEVILDFATWIPVFSFLEDKNIYRILNEALVTALQLRMMQKLAMLSRGQRFYNICIAAAAIPAIVLHQTSYAFGISMSLFYAMVYILLLDCFLKLPKDLEKQLLLFAWVLTSVTRLFLQCCEIGLLPYGDIDLRLRFRGIISCIYIAAFFLVACRRFSQKFQAATDLNLHLEEALSEKYKQQTSFIRSMLHNLKTPLFSLSGYSEMALQSLNENPKQAREYLLRINKKSLYASNMMDQIFFATQMEANLVAFQVLPLNLSGLLQSVLETSQPQADMKNIAITMQVPDIMQYTGDPLYLQQAFQNIVDNALNHTSTGGSIEIAGAQCDSCWYITFKDSGCGICKKDQEKIFDAYYSNRSGNAESSGLGLFITKEILLRHHGGICVESEVNRGSKFIITLPFIAVP